MKHLFVALLASLLAFGCATNEVTENPLAEYHATKPQSILIVPVLNQSLDVTASAAVLTTLPRMLGERGYYVFPVHTTKTLLEYEGLMEPQLIHDQPTDSLARLFSADSVLYVTIHSWTSQYAVLQTTTVVDLEYRLTNKLGNTIYSDRKTMTYTPESSGDTGSIWGDLIASALTAAVERAKPNYMPLTREANSRALLNKRYPLPPGPYHPDFETYYQTIVSQQEAQSQAAAQP